MLANEIPHELFWWLLGNDPLDSLILGCVGNTRAKDMYVRPSSAYLEWPGCLNEAPVGVVAQILACNVKTVEILPCDCVTANAEPKIFRRWQALTPGLVHMHEPRRKRPLSFLKRAGQRLDFADLQIPRRILFGMNIEAPFNLDDPHDLATLKALEHLRKLGRLEENEPVLANKQSGQGGGIKSQELAQSGATQIGTPQRDAVQRDADQAVVNQPQDLAVASIAADKHTEEAFPESDIRGLLAPECHACGVCVRYCPVSALTIRELDDISQTDPNVHRAQATNCVLDEKASSTDGLFVRQLVFEPATCVNCNKCISICPHNLLRWDEPFDLRTMKIGSQQVLSANVMANCSGCKVPFVTDQAGSLCELCLFRQDNPFGFKLPPGFIPKKRIT